MRFFRCDLSCGWHGVADDAVTACPRCSRWHVLEATQPAERVRALEATLEHLVPFATVSFACGVYQITDKKTMIWIEDMLREITVRHFLLGVRSYFDLT